jgi:sugar lactone lactonase YvrE
MKTNLLIGMLAASWLVSTAGAQYSVNTVSSNGLAEPCGVTADSDGNFYIADSVNNRIAKVDVNTGNLSTFTGLGSPGSLDGPVYVAQFSDPQGILYTTLNGTQGLIVADTRNQTIRFVNLTNGSVSTLAGIPGSLGTNNGAAATATFSYPVGLSLDSANNLYIADSGNNAIRVLNLASMTVATLSVPNTTFYQPNAVAVGDANQLWVADTRNHAVKLITLSTPTTGTLTTYMGSNNRNAPGTNDSVFGANARFNNPRGLLWLSGSGLVIADTGNNAIRVATNYAAIGANNYAVGTLAGLPGQYGYLDGTSLAAKFNSPFGLSVDPFGNDFLVADEGNNALRSVQTGPARTQVTTPQIGWVKMVVDSFGVPVTQLQTAQPFVFNNDVTIAVLAEDATATLYTVAATPTNLLSSPNIPPTPTSANGSTPPPYQDGATTMPSTLLTNPPNYDFTIKAISTQIGRRPSSVNEARFVFVAANPQIIGNNAAQFTVQDATTNATLLYTLDGNLPTNGAPDTFSTTAGGQSLVVGNSDVTYTIQAFKNGYKASEPVTTIFNATNYVPNRISYGYASGEASTAFVGAPGQTFYAPVTLTLLPQATMYSLQFNSTVTNLTPAPPVTPGAVDFVSMLLKPDPSIQGVYLTIPPAMYLGLITTVSYVTNIVGTNTVITTNYTTAPGSIDPPPAAQIIHPWYYNPAMPFLDLTFTNKGENLMGVGWLEVKGVLGTNLYNTMQQDLITYSRAHNTLFLSSGGRVILGAYSFAIPGSATAGQQYQITLARASATSDGIGAPGSDVVIQSPTNGSYTAGAINGTKYVTVGQVKYVVGDVYPFRWFNAGDFGDTNLDNADVEQAFQGGDSAIHSDFFDAMDSCCVEGVYTNVNGNPNAFLVPSATALNGSGQNVLFNGSDTADINNMVFGDGVIDVSDVFVTFRRSLDPGLTWYERFWTNGVRGALPIGNPPTALASPSAGISPAAGTGSGSSSGSTNVVPPGVNFTAGDAVTGPGQTLSIPITATVFGSYPLRVLMLKLTVEPLDGSPAITSQIQFAPVAALGSPTLSESKSPNNLSAAWLNNAIAGFTGSTVIGTLVVTLPPNATASSAYAVHFDHASGSPTGIGTFPGNAFTGLITLADRSGSSWKDGIPDAWRLRYFGTVSNLLSAPSADADGDGVPNSAEYAAGTDPTNPKSYLHVSSQGYSAQSFNLHWPSAAGVTYIIETSPTMFGGTWTPVSTNTGTGGDMQIQDNNGGQHQFYRVRVAQ